jgi:F-type H+-transporting ATPase subunit delta
MSTGPGTPEAQAPAPAPPTVFDETSAELARTYADALLNASQKAGQVDGVLDELDAINAEMFQRFPVFAMMMGSPFRTAAEKDQLIVRTLEGRADPTVVRFLRVLNRHGRLGLLGPVCRVARESWDRRQNRRPVTVRSAVPLTDGQAGALRDRLAGSLGATPVLRFEVDPSLIAGLVVQVGDDVYDASVRNRLGQLRQRLTEGKTHEIQSRRDHFSHPE